MQYPRTLQNNIYHSNKGVPPPFFNSDTNPVFGQVLIHSFDKNPCSGCNSGISLVVALQYTFFQVCSNVEQLSVRLTRFRRSYVKRPVVVLTSHTSNIGSLLDVRCAFQNRHFSFFCSLPLMIVYLRNLLFDTPLARMFLTPRWVSRQKGEKM